MTHDDVRIAELEKRLEHQDAVIATYEAASGLYRRLKRFPFLGRVARRAAAWLRPAAQHGLTVVDNVRSERPSLIGVCNPRFSGGVKSSTYALCPDVVEVSDLFDRAQAERAARVVVGHAPDRVLISGYTLGYDLLIEEIARLAPSIRIFAYVHSAFIWFAAYPDENPVFMRFLELERAGAVERIAFCKRDVAEYFRSRGHDARFVMNRFELSSTRHARSGDGVVRIGVWGRDLWHRNILNQVIGALMVPGSEVHVNELPDLEFLERDRIVVHGYLPKAEFDRVFASMDINLYVSFTDCFPMTLIESMEAGIPCIASDTSDVYAFDPELHSRLVVSTVDGPLGIAAAVDRALDDYGWIQDRIESYLPALSAEVEKSIEEFLA